MFYFNSLKGSRFSLNTNNQRTIPVNAGQSSGSLQYNVYTMVTK